jgi:putative tricarboxylic transport membrane protein
VTTDRRAALVLAAFGIFITAQAWRLPYWLDRSPGPGFVPLWLGILLTICAGWVFVRAKATAPREAEDQPTGRSDPYALAIMTTLAAAVVPLVGLVAATGALTAAAAWRLDPRRPLAIVAATLATPLLVWLVFVRWLGVPLP